MDKSLCTSLIKWLSTFPGHENITAASLTDGVAMAAILHQIAPEYFNSQWLSKIRTDVGDNWRLKVSNLRKIHQGLMDYPELPGQAQFPNPDLNKIGEQGDEIELGRLLQLILGCAINCEQQQKHIEAIMGMEEGVQALIVNAIQDLMNRESSPGIDASGGASSPSVPWLGPASFHPQIKTLQEQLELTSLAKEDMARRCNELDLQISVIGEERNKFKDENEKLLERIEVLETGGDIGAQSFRYKDLRKQVDTLKDELYKVEASRDEYRSRVEGLDKEIKKVTARNEDLQHLANEAIFLKDEVDALRGMSDRVTVYEGTIETLKKKLEEMNDLRRQVKKLEEKNSDYMQQNLVLEEEIKESGTLRPQVDLYKKQVSDLHQELAEEAKKYDRQIFENKKLTEKLESLTVEKERIMLERDVLKENLDELKCTVSALSSPDTASRPPSDLSDIDTLEIIPPEIREKLVRLQHENRLLKQKANEKSDESSPVLQSLLNDLQERHEKLLQENRWDKFCPPSSTYPKWSPSGRTGSHPLSQSLLDAYFMLDTPKKLKLLKRNLKWASESDLLILRQPSNLLASFLSANSKTKHNSNPKSLTLPASISPVSSNGKDNPIVIHHIHEFKMPPSPTNEDSGCCRTSPSSCEGCEDHPSGSFGTRTPEYGGTLDSGVSGMYRCLSPVIPSIVEECTTHHMSDILPALLGQEGTIPPVMYHTHPAHSNCYCCCSKPLPCDTNPDIQAKRSCSPHLQSNSSCTPFTNDIQAFQHAKIIEQSTILHPTNKYSSHEDSESLSSSLQSRKQSFPKKPDPPDSPTPHNSPRLPHSIHSNRSKGGKPHFQIQYHSSYNSGLSDAPNSLVARSPSPEKGKLPDRKVKSNINTYEKFRSKTPDKLISKTVVNIEPVQSESDRFRASFRGRNLDTSKVKTLDKVRSKSLDKCKSNDTKLSIHNPAYSCYSANTDTCHLKTSLNGNALNQPEIELTKSSNELHLEIIDKIRAYNEKYQRSNNTVLSTSNNNNNNYDTSSSSSFSSITKPNMLTNYVGKSSLPTPYCSTKKVDLVSSESRKEANGRTFSRELPTFGSFREKSSFREKKTLPPLLISRRNSEIEEKKTSENKEKITSAQIHYDKTINGGLSNDFHPTLKKFSNPFSHKSEIYPPLANLLQKSNNDSFFKSNSKHTDWFTFNEKRRQSSANDICNPKTQSNVKAATSDSLITSRELNVAPKKAKSAEVTLLTDTMFTHFVVSPKRNPSSVIPKSPKESNNGSNPSLWPRSQVLKLPLQISKQTSKNREIEPLLSDGDNDLELVENKLVTSAFGAPLVSSESFTSIQQSDQTDNDPSATDYFTDNISEMDFNPSQYHISTDETSRLSAIPSRNRKVNKGKNKPSDLLRESLNLGSSSNSITKSDNFFKKKKNKVLSESKRKFLNGGVVKVKNKTAKAVVAETFNAMFTFCTP